MKNEKKIIEWLNDDLSSQELDDLKKSEGFETLEKIAHYASHLESPTIDAPAALAAFKRRNLAKSETKVRTLNFKTVFKVAAVLVVLLSSSYFLFFDSIQSYETGIAQTKTFRLPDNSEVLLNAASKITFNKNKWKNNRELTLDGEAYFQVQKGETFSVQTADGIVKVLGTHFSVKQRQNYYEVSCYEGLVSVTYNNTIVKIPPGKTFRVINKKMEAVAESNDEKPSWMLQESNFTRIPLNQVIAELERQYDLKVKTDSVDITKLFTGSFTHNNQKIALEAVTVPLKLSYKVEGKTIIFYNYEVE
jgi:ferric-dicitrate binding protein FerR (iron transport regulator)